MLRTAITPPDTELAAYLHRVLGDIDNISVVRIVDRYPAQIDLTRMLRSLAPQALFVCAESPDDATTVASHVEKVMPGIQVIAVGRSCEPATLMEIMRAGIREYLAAPFERRCVTECLKRVNENLSRRPVAVQASELLYSFLPAKPGVGATTLAINSCIAASQEPGRKRVTDGLRPELRDNAVHAQARKLVLGAGRCRTCLEHGRDPLAPDCYADAQASMLCTPAF